jgi:hypothetical protein
MLVAVFAVTLPAQGQQPASPGDRPTTQGERPTTAGQQPTTGQVPPPTMQVGKTTIAGCVQAAAPTAAGGASAAPSSKFELTNAKVVSSAEATGTTGAATSALRYRLEGDEKTISPHLNHQVEITGTSSPATMSGAAGNTTPTPILKIESLKMVAATCPSASPGTAPGR